MIAFLNISTTTGIINSVDKNGHFKRDYQLLYKKRRGLYTSEKTDNSAQQCLLHDWCNKGRGMYYPVCGMMHIK